MRFVLITRIKRFYRKYSQQKCKRRDHYELEKCEE